MDGKNHKPLTFASVCSGIGGADLGLEQAGMRPLWFCEKDPHARAQMFRHWPTITCYEDLTRLEGRKLARPNVLHGSTPCQGFSIAGMRGSLEDARSNLCMSFVTLADQLGPEYITWENVPGVLSTKDNAFGCFLAALVGFNQPLIHPDIRGFKQFWRGKPGKRFHVWPNCGVVIGPKRVASWRVLDSQFFGVPQRRRRVFVIVDSGDGSSAEILFEPEGLRRDTPPSRQAKEGDSGAPRKGAAGGSFEDVAPALLAGENSTGGHRPLGMCPDTVHSLQVTGTLNSAMGATRGAGQDPNLLCAATAGTVTASGARKTDRGDSSANEMLVSASVTSKWAKGSGGPAGDECQNLLAFETKQDPVSAEELSPTMRALDNVAIASALAVRRLTPLECERLQGFPDGHTEGQSDAQRYKQLGNAVTTTVERWIGMRIIKHHESRSR